MVQLVVSNVDRKVRNKRLPITFAPQFCRDTTNTEHWVLITLNIPSAVESKFTKLEPGRGLRETFRLFDTAGRGKVMTRHDDDATGINANAETSATFVFHNGTRTSSTIHTA